MALPVNDLRTAIDFYTKVVGLVLELQSDDGAFLWTGSTGQPQRLIRELASDETTAKTVGDAWLNALEALDTTEARQILLSLVDPEIKASFNVLAQIDTWRLEHGRPLGEPRSVEIETESAWPNSGTR